MDHAAAGGRIHASSESEIEIEIEIEKNRDKTRKRRQEISYHTGGPGVSRASWLRWLRSVPTSGPVKWWQWVGPNGAGKSTLFSLILGFLEPSAGEIAIQGDDPRAYIRKHGAGYLPERFRLPPEWPVRDALRAFAGLERIAVRNADVAIETFGLREHATKTVAMLSHGMVQRVGLAQAFMAERMLLVLGRANGGAGRVLARAVPGTSLPGSARAARRS